MKIKKTHSPDGKTIGFKVERTPEEQAAFDAKHAADTAKRKEEGAKIAAENLKTKQAAAEARAPIERALQACAHAKDPEAFLKAAPALARVLDRVDDLNLRGLKPMYERAVSECTAMLPAEQKALEEIAVRMRRVGESDARAFSIKDALRMLDAEDSPLEISKQPVVLPPAPSRSDSLPPSPPKPPQPKRTLGQEIDDIPRAVRQIWKDLWKK